ncbi:hypothetical protein [Actinoplanes regularis]|uniref:hypothetical protein n=1 Tax=Actinoplanes regularis TaxID=52697 RepID=UPI00255348FD|nr:hypothetical protein [Actinoplanes regularis]
MALVETPVSRWYVKRARLAFICVSLGVWAAVTAVASAFMPLWAAMLLGLVAGVVIGLVAAVLVRVWPVLRVLWWWSLEITIAAVVVAVPSVLLRVMPWWLALTVMALLGATLFVVGPVRRFLWAWWWCAFDRHRLRLCFTGMARSSAGGSGSRPLQIPLMLWARPTPAGERVWMWLRPGLSLDQLDGKTGLIAVTCGAADVRLTRARQNLSTLVRVDITRRDPLTGLVPSPLALLVPKPVKKSEDDESVVPVSPAVPLFGLDLADVPEPPAPEPRGGGRR